MNAPLTTRTLTLRESWRKGHFGVVCLGGDVEDAQILPTTHRVFPRLLCMIVATFEPDKHHLDYHHSLSTNEEVDAHYHSPALSHFFAFTHNEPLSITTSLVGNRISRPSLSLCRTGSHGWLLNDNNVQICEMCFLLRNCDWAQQLSCRRDF